MKVYAIEHLGMGMGYMAECPSWFEPELENELKENIFENEDDVYTKEEIEPFIEKCKNLNTDEYAELGAWIISCYEMDEEEFRNLPEWEGW